MPTTSARGPVPAVPPEDGGPGNGGPGHGGPGHGGPGNGGPGNGGPEDTPGVAFPRDDNGRRSTTALGRAVVAAALAPVDPAGARAAVAETAWRGRYVGHVRRTVEVTLADPHAALDLARAGLAAVHERMRVVTPDGEERPLTALADTPAAAPRRTVELRGDGRPDPDVVVPYRGRRLRGDDLRRQLDAWLAAGALEPSAAAAVGEVVDHPEWRAAAGHTVVALGAGAELGPAATLLRWGATVAAVDVARPEAWARLRAAARTGGGRLLVPAAADRTGADDLPGASDTALADAAGADLLVDVPALADWVVGLPGAVTVGTYVYADGGTHLRLSAAADALVARVGRARPDVTLAWLATPTDVYAVPAEAVAASAAAYERRGAAARVLGRPLRSLSRGRLLRRNYRPDADPGLCDALVPAQGPNYALAKHLQRWRATVTRRDGRPVSFHVAPSSRTRSVVRNRTLAAAYAGAHRFGVEVFEPDTATVLMALLLVHDLHVPPPRHDHPWRDEAWAAVHGGLWRGPYAPRSALGLAAVLGLAAARRR